MRVGVAVVWVGVVVVWAGVSMWMWWVGLVLQQIRSASLSQEHVHITATVHFKVQGHFGWHTAYQVLLHYECNAPYVDSIHICMCLYAVPICRLRRRSVG